MKLEQAHQLQAAINDILNLHRQNFRAAAAPVAPEPPPIDERIVLTAHRKALTKGVNILKLAEWRDARQTADTLASREIEQLKLERKQLHRLYEQELRRGWHALLANDPAVLLPTVNAAFMDNEAPAVAVEASGSAISVVTLVPGLELIPERKPATTPKGNLSLKKLTKSERGALHMTAVASHILLTIRETFAVGPRVTSIKLIAVQHERRDSDGHPQIEPIVAAVFSRDTIEKVDWQTGSSLDIFQNAGSDLIMNVRRAANELRPINLSASAMFSGILEKITLDQLLARR